MKDKGVDVSGAKPTYEGDYYFHFTVFRGVGAQPGSIPAQLQQSPQTQQPPQGQQPAQANQVPANIAGMYNNLFKP